MTTTETVYVPCDRCNARSAICAQLGDMVLHFCQHHGTKQQAALQAKGWTVSLMNSSES